MNKQLGEPEERREVTWGFLRNLKDANASPNYAELNVQDYVDENEGDKDVLQKLLSPQSVKAISKRLDPMEKSIKIETGKNSNLSSQPAARVLKSLSPLGIFSLRFMHSPKQPLFLWR